jgi:hypothetical protein
MATGQVFLLPSNSVLPYQHHSTNASYTSSSAFCSYLKDKQAKLWNILNSKVLSKIWEFLIEKSFHFSEEFLGLITTVSV